MKAAVTGATGYVGRFVVPALLAHGCRVSALVRAGSDRSGFAQPPEWTTGLDELVEGADVLIHCAFGHLPGRYRGGEGDDPVGFWKENHLGTVRLLDAARRAGVQRVIYLSSRAVYGSDLPQEIPEDHPVAPDTHYGALKVAGESLAAVFPEMSFVSLRATGVFGITHPVARSKWRHLLAELAEGRLPEPRTGTEVHGADLADAVIRLLDAPAGAYNCSDIIFDTTQLVSMACDEFALELPAPGPAPLQRGVMRCDKMHALGWRPRGAEAVRETVRSLGESVGLKVR